MTKDPVRQNTEYRPHIEGTAGTGDCLSREEGAALHP